MGFWGYYSILWGGGSFLGLESAWELLQSLGFYDVGYRI